MAKFVRFDDRYVFNESSILQVHYNEMFKEMTITLGDKYITTVTISCDYEDYYRFTLKLIQEGE